MTEQLRFRIAQEIFADVDRRELGLDVKNREDFVTSEGGNKRLDWSRWYFFAFSYQQAFEKLWDAATARLPTPLDHYPLMFICRQSIELWLKAAISTVKQTRPPAGHKLGVLWSELLEVLSIQIDRGMWADGAYPEFVEGVIQILDAHDDKGDRFRYPTTSGGHTYPSTKVDLHELYRAHELIAGFCDAVITQMKVEREFEV